MKYLVPFVMTLSMSAVADTVITYDDGTTYTLKEGEKIYISADPLYTDYVGVEADEHDVRDQDPEPPAPDPTPEPEPVVWEHGTNGTCANYEYQGPLSFGHVTQNQEWRQKCDTNGDGVYNFCEDYDPANKLTFGGYDWIDWEYDKVCRD